MIVIANGYNTYTYKHLPGDFVIEKMAAYIPRFLLKYLSLLYREFSFNEFHFQDAIRVLGLDVGYAGQVLSRLVEAGWIAKKRNAADLRKKSYRIIDVTFNDIMKDIGDGPDEK